MITNHGGEIYLYKGDDLIAVWSWAAAKKGAPFSRPLTRCSMRLSGNKARTNGYSALSRIFGLESTVATWWSEQGDTKRSIGIYSDAINIAARMEDAAAAHGVRCILSKTVAEALANR